MDYLPYIVIGIYLVIGAALCVWAHMETLPHERHAIPYLKLLVGWIFFIAWRIKEAVEEQVRR